MGVMCAGLRWKGYACWRPILGSRGVSLHGGGELRLDDDYFGELFKKPPHKPTTETSWQDVGAEFEALGKTLGDVLRGAWQRQDADAGLNRLRDSGQAVIQGMNRAGDGTPEAQEARDRLVEVTERIRAAAARAGDELRPELVTMLRQANAELRRFTRLDE